MRIGVAGYGSIGRRHVRNLTGPLGVAATSLAIWDPVSVREPPEGAAVLPSFEALLACDAVLVCSPTVFHADQALQVLAAGRHLFLEKPAVAKREELAPLRAAAKGKTAAIGYTLRAREDLRLLRSWLRSGKLGAPLSLRAWFGWALPLWRPGTDWRWSYSARRDQGGGILRDDSHEVDYVCWLLEDRGTPTVAACTIANTGTLGVDVEEQANILGSFASGPTFSIHMDYLSQAYERGCSLVGSELHAAWDAPRGELVLRRGGEEVERRVVAEAHERAYVTELDEFLRACRGEPIELEASLERCLASESVLFDAIDAARRTVWRPQPPP